MEFFSSWKKYCFLRVLPLLCVQPAAGQSLDMAHAAFIVNQVGQPQAAKQTLIKVLAEIKAHYKVSFLYQKKNLDGIDVEGVIRYDLPLATLLNDLLKPIGLRFERTDGNTYVIMPSVPRPDHADKSVNPESRTDPGHRDPDTDPSAGGSISYFQTIAGTITDEKGEAISGASVTVKGTSTGTVTDLNGYFKIAIDNGGGGNAILVFSHVGYNPQEVAIGGRSIINVQLTAAANSLNAIVVIAYGTSTKKDLTGAVSTISAADIEKTPSLSPQQAMQGRMAGVQVSTAGGDPNDAPTVRIRGVTTFSGQNSDPLYVVDGIVINDYGSKSVFSVSQQKAGDIMGTQNVFNLINPNDIESISVLKDASSAAAYGSRAANGVVLITTKRGHEGRAKVNVAAQYGISNVPKLLPVLNTRQYVAIENEANLGNPNWWPSTGTYKVYNPADPAYLGNSATYDWQKAIENRNAAFQEYSMSVSGGNAGSTYYVGADYTDDQSDLKFNAQKRYSLTAKTDFNVNKFFEAGQSLRLAYTALNDQRNSTGNAADLYHLRRIAPWQPIYDPNGYKGFADALPNTYGAVNPNYLAIPSTVNHTFGTLKALGNVYATITPLRNLHITGTVAIDYTTLRRLSLSTDSSALFNSNGSSTGNEIEDLNSLNFTLTKRVNATYSIKAGKSSLDLYAHAEQENFNYHYAVADQAGISGVSDPYLFQADGGATSIGISTKDGNAHQGYLGRADYKYDDKYYLDVTVLRQGSSLFNPQGYQWGTFPSAAAAWRISREDFMKGLTFVDDLKIKGGFGELGNDDVQGFQYLSLVQNQFAQYTLGAGNGQSGTVRTGSFLSNFPNYNLTWERISTYNIGFEATLLKNLTFSAEYYDRETSKILQVYSLPASAGLSNNPYKNIGAATNKGIELTAAYQNHIGDFHYNVGVNLTTTTNKVTQLNGNTPVSTPAGPVVLGDPINSIYGYKEAGVIKTQKQLTDYQARNAGSPYVSALQLGDLMYQDIAGAPTAADVAAGRQYHHGADGQVNGYDGLLRLGKTIPGYFYGITLEAAYKDFDISLLFSGVGDVQKVNTILEDGVTYGLQNQLTTVLDHWTPSNPNSSNPRAVAYGASAANNTLFSDRFVQNAAYLRLSNVQLGYSLPERLTGNARTFSKIRVFLSGSNLFLITKYTGYDPDNDLVPPARTLLLGANLSF